MRVFVAIDLPETLTRALVEIQSQLRPVASSARWVQREAIHLTLKFIGEVPGPKLGEIDESLRTVAFQPFDVHLAGLGFFPDPRSARVLWAGVHSSHVASLAGAIEEAAVKAGIPKDKRPFSAHLTLARARETRFDRKLVESVSAMPAPDFGNFAADRFFLFRSELKPGGSVYTRLKEYGCAGSGGDNQS